MAIVKQKLARLFYDIEVSPNIVLAWSTGYKLNISYENILQERAIICICWKWEGNPKVHSLSWDKGDDEAMLRKFVKVVEQADEVIGHNSDRFDTKWLRTRCAFHGIPLTALIKGVDTLKMSRGSFKFNSNRLDYVGKFLGCGGKLETAVNDWGLWRRVIKGDQKALTLMLQYCRRDVELLEQVYHKLADYAPVKTHVAMLTGGTKADCPQCGSSNCQRRGYRVTAGGTRSQIMSCNKCGRNFTIALERQAPCSAKPSAAA